MNRPEAIRITSADLHSEHVEEVLKEQSALAGAMPDSAPLPLLRRLLYATWFYLALAGTAGGVVGWAILEPFMSDESAEFDLVALLLFPTIAACIGIAVGAAEGIMCRNARRACQTALVGGAIGFAGALIATLPAGAIFVAMVSLAVEVSPVATDQEMPSGGGFVLLMVGRAIAWSIIAIAAGIGQGVALRERRMTLNGLIGGALGGFLGGLLFDPLYVLLGLPEEAAASRAVGFAIIGGSVGLFVGLVEQWTRTAWLFMKAGPLAGKQFVLYRDPTVVGSSPKADIYLFKDPAIEPRHALIHSRGGRYEIEDCGTPAGTFVNGVATKRRILRPGDHLALGTTVLEFSLRDAGKGLDG